MKFPAYIDTSSEAVCPDFYLTLCFYFTDCSEQKHPASEVFSLDFCLPCQYNPFEFSFGGGNNE